MSDIYEVFDEPMDESVFPDGPFDKDAWKESKQAERNGIYSLIDEMVKGMQTNEAAMQKYLQVQARFNRYSPINAILITAQYPEATKLKDYEGWKELRGMIRKGEKSIVILEPGEEYIKKDGTKGVSYHTKKLFDLSQTTIKAEPEVKEPVEMRTLLRPLIYRSPVPVRVVDDLKPEYNGAFYDHAKKEILVSRGLTENELFQSLTREIAHAELAGPKYIRKKETFSASCVSYMLCSRYGIDTENLQFESMPKSMRELPTTDMKAELKQNWQVMNEINDMLQPQRQRADQTVQRKEAAMER